MRGRDGGRSRAPESTGTAACLLGKSWGYDDDGIWVDDGCGGEFATGVVSEAAPAGQEGEQEQEEEYADLGDLYPG